MSKKKLEIFTKKALSALLAMSCFFSVPTVYAEDTTENDQPITEITTSDEQQNEDESNSEEKQEEVINDRSSGESNEVIDESQDSEESEESAVLDDEQNRNAETADESEENDSIATYGTGSGTASYWYYVNIDPNGGTYKGSNSVTTLRKYETYSIAHLFEINDIPIRNGYKFVRWKADTEDQAGGQIYSGRYSSITNATTSQIKVNYTTGQSSGVDNGYTTYTLMVPNTTSAVKCPAITFFSFPLSVGHTYNLSFDINVTKTNASTLDYARVSLSAFNGEQNPISADVSKNTGGWQHISIKRTFSSNTTTENGKTYTNAPLVKFECSIPSGKSAIMAFDLKNISVYDETNNCYVDSKEALNNLATFQALAANETLRAQWKKTYKLSITGDEGVQAIYGTGEFTANSTAPVQYVIKPGYHFVKLVGTSVDGVENTVYTDYAGQEGTIDDSWGIKTCDRTVKLITAPNEYTVSYDANGGTGKMDSSLAKFNQNFITKQNIFENPGYVFTGWNTKADGTGENWNIKYGASGTYESGTPWKWTYFNDITLYAQWKKADFSNINGVTLIQGPSFHNYIPSGVTTITFTNKTAPKDATYVDLSEEGDCGIIGWKSGNEWVISTQRINDKVKILFNANSSQLFMNSPVTTYNFDNIDTSHVTNASLMFWGNSNISNLDLSMFDVSNIESMGQMFYGCQNLNKLNLKGWNANKITGKTGISSMFNNCSKLTELDLSGFNTASVTSTEMMFYGCSNLKTIFVSNKWDMSKVTNSFWMFYKCSSIVGQTGTTYSSSKTEVSMANYQSGYLTFKEFEVEYNVNYVSSSGTLLGTSTVSGTYGSSKSVTPPAKTGYTAPAAQTVKFDSTTAKTITFTYTPVNYTITYNLNGGSLSGQKTSYTIESADFTLPSPTKAGNTFAGWTGSNGTTAQTSVKITKGSSGNKTYTANWTVNKYYLDLNGILDGKSSANITNYGTADIYINGTKVSSGVTDYYSQYPYGTTYKIVVTPTEGHSVNKTTWEGTITGTTGVAPTFTTNKYTITYKYNVSGSTTADLTQSVTYGTAWTSKANNAFSRKGYALSSWNTQADGKGTTYSVNTAQTSKQLSNVTLYAQWKGNTYALKFHPNGGTLNVTDSNITKNSDGTAIVYVTYGSTNYYYLGITASKTGYTMTGFYTASSGGTKLWGNGGACLKDGTYWNSSDQWAYDGAVDIYPQFTANKYTYNIKYVSSSGVSLGTSTVAGIYGSSVTVTPPAKAGYTAPTNQTVKFDSTTAKTITFTYTPITYTISYDVNSGNTLSGQRTSYTIESSAYTLPTPTRSGYTFTGWTGSNGTTPQTSVTIAKGSTGNLSYKANWKVSNYTITYKANNGSSTADQTQSVSYGTAWITKGAIYSKNGYTQTSWNTKADGTGTKYSLSTQQTDKQLSNLTLYAQYTVSTYKITYNVNGGNALSGQKTSYTIETADYTLPIPTRTGYTFTGWTGSNGTTPQTTVKIAKGSTGDKSYTANWSVNNYTVTYNANNGTGTMSADTVAYGSAYKTKKNGYSYPGYTFDGWNTKADGSGTVWSLTGAGTYESGKAWTWTYTSSITLYAQWKKNAYAIGYNVNGGNALSGQSTSYNVDTTAYTLPTPTRTGYTFNGWSESISTTNWTSGFINLNTGAIEINSTYTNSVFSERIFLKKGVTYTISGASLGGIRWRAYKATDGTYIGNVSQDTSYTPDQDMYVNILLYEGVTAENRNAMKITSSKATSIAKGSTGTRNYTANWSAKAYTITLNPNGGNWSGSTAAKALSPNLFYGQGNWNNLNGQKPARTGYTFAGWFTAASGGTKVYNADGTCVNEGTYWKNSGYVHDGNLTVYAQWTVNSYTNSIYHWAHGFKNQEGENGDKTAIHLGDTTFKKNYGDKVTYTTNDATTIPNGFSLSNGFGSSAYEGSWKTYSMGTSFTQPAKSTGVEYDYFPNTYTITYNLNGGTNASSNPSTYNVLYGVTFTNPTRTGYTFAGWYIDDTKVNGINAGANATFTSASDLYTKLASRSTGNKTVTAKWTANSYTVAYNGNTATSGSTSNTTHTYDTAKNLASNGFRKDGYTFKNWNTKSDGSGASYSNGASVKNLVTSGTVTLYAQWTAKSASITYSAGDNGKVDKTSETVTGTNKATGSTATANAGYHLDGWYGDNPSKKITGSAKLTPGNPNAQNGFGSTGYYGGKVTYDSTTKTYSVTASASSMNASWGSGTAFLRSDEIPYEKWYIVTMEVYSPIAATLKLDNNDYACTGSSWSGNDNDTNRNVYGFGSIKANTWTKVMFAYQNIHSGNTNKAAIYDCSGIGLLYDTSLGDQTFKIRNVQGMIADSFTGSASSYTAKFAANTYTVKYDGNGATSGSTASSTHTYDAYKALTANGFTRTGYTFAGWNTQSDGKGTAYANSASVKNLTATNNGTVTLYAQWTLNTYSISYTLNGGSISSQPTSYNVNTATFTLPKPTKTGYTFTGWTGSNGTTAQTSVSIAKGSTGNKSYTANWKVNSYTITYKANGGTGADQTQTVTYGTAWTSKNTTFTKTGYTQTSWNTNADGSGTKYSLNTKQTDKQLSNVTLYAQYTPHTLKINYHNDGASQWTVNPGGNKIDATNKDIVQTESVRYDEIYDHASNGLLDAIRFIKTGYSAAGYWKVGSKTSSTRVSYADNSLANYGTNGQGVAKFLGALKELEKGDATVDLYPDFIPNSYTIKYNGNGNTGGSTANSSHTYDTAKALTANGFTKTGYTFTGWNTQADGKGTAYADKASVKNLSSTNGATINLYAQWKANVLTIVYYPNGATKADNSSNMDGSDISAIDPNASNLTYTWKYDETLPSYGLWDSQRYIRTGYSSKNKYRVGSKDGTTLLDAGPNVYAKTQDLAKAAGKLANLEKGDVTINIYADWTPIGYTVTYNLDGGSITGQKTSYNIETATFTLPTPSKTGYTFAGWTGSNGSTPQTSVSIAKGSTGNKTYTAKWTAKTYTVTYNANGGTGTMSGDTVTFNTAFKTKQNTFKREGFIFDGWNEKADGTGTRWNITSGSSGTYESGKAWTWVYASNITLYAQWVPESYNWTVPTTINFDGSSTAKSGTISVTENKLASGRTLKIKIADDTSFKLKDKSNANNTCDYTVKKGSETLKAGSTVLSLPTDTKNANQAISININKSQIAGTYEDILKFTASVE